MKNYESDCGNVYGETLLKYADCHTHTFYSHDGKLSTKDALSRAEKSGDFAFCITEHCDVEFSYCADVKSGVIASVKAARALSAEKKSATEILCGVEMGSPTDGEKAAYSTINSILPDEIILSVHSFAFRGERAPYSQIDFSRFSQRQTDDYFALYFEALYKNALNFPFDVLAHLTCPIRYLTYKYGKRAEISFDAIIGKILALVVERNAALELNVSNNINFGRATDGKLLMPQMDIITKFIALGGKYVAIGSDAHAFVDSRAAFDFAASELKRTGVVRACYFRNRCPVLYDL